MAVPPRALLQDVSVAIKEIQRAYCDNPDAPLTGACTPVLALCAHMDLILRDGLLSSFKSAGAYWRYVQSFTRAEIISKINHLKQVKTELGKGRAWVRIALMESSLEAYLRMIVSDEEKKLHFYEKSAFVCSVEHMELLMTLLSGLEIIQFDVVVDTPTLDPMVGGLVSHDSSLPSPTPPSHPSSSSSSSSYTRSWATLPPPSSTASPHPPSLSTIRRESSLLSSPGSSTPELSSSLASSSSSFPFSSSPPSSTSLISSPHSTTTTAAATTTTNASSNSPPGARKVVAKKKKKGAVIASHPPTRPSLDSLPSGEGAETGFPTSTIPSQASLPALSSLSLSSSSAPLPSKASSLSSPPSSLAAETTSSGSTPVPMGTASSYPSPPSSSLSSLSSPPAPFTAPSSLPLSPSSSSSLSASSASASHPPYHPPSSSENNPRDLSSFFDRGAPSDSNANSQKLAVSSASAHLPSAPSSYSSSSAPLPNPPSLSSLPSSSLPFSSSPLSKSSPLPTPSSSSSASALAPFATRASISTTANSNGASYGGSSGGGSGVVGSSGGGLVGSGGSGGGAHGGNGVGSGAGAGAGAGATRGSVNGGFGLGSSSGGSASANPSISIGVASGGGTGKDERVGSVTVPLSQPSLSSLPSSSSTFSHGPIPIPPSSREASSLSSSSSPSTSLSSSAPRFPSPPPTSSLPPAPSSVFASPLSVPPTLSPSTTPSLPSSRSLPPLSSSIPSSLPPPPSSLRASDILRDASVLVPGAAADRSPPPARRGSFTMMGDGTGGDVDLKGNNNLLVLIKLQVLQGDDEAIMKCVWGSTVDGLLEHRVIVLVTSAALYVLRQDAASSNFRHDMSIPLQSIKNLVTACFNLSFIVTLKHEAVELFFGDESVCRVTLESLRDACKAVGHNPARTGSRTREDKVYARIASLTLEDYDAKMVYYGLAYKQCAAGAVMTERQVWRQGSAVVLEGGLLKNSWRPVVLQLRGDTLLVQGKGEALPRLRLNTLAADVVCRHVQDSERFNCFELGTSAETITLSCESAKEVDDWIRAVQWRPVCLLPGAPSPSPEPGHVWLLVTLVLTASHVLVFMQNHTTSDMTIISAIPILSLGIAHRDGASSLRLDTDSDEGTLPLAFKTPAAREAMLMALRPVFRASFQAELQEQ